MPQEARSASRTSAGPRNNGRRSTDSPVAASVATGCQGVGEARTPAKSIGASWVYTTSVSVRRSTSGRRRSRFERRTSIFVYDGSIQPTSRSGWGLASQAAVIAPEEAP